MPAWFGACQQVGRQSCRRTARIPHCALSGLSALVAIRPADTPGVAGSRCRREQGVGKLGRNEDHRNSALKSRNNKIQYFGLLKWSLIDGFAARRSTTEAVAD